MNTEELHALRQVIDMYANDEHGNWLETGRPRGHIVEAFSTLDKYRQARSPELDNESLSRARRGDGAEDPPVEEAASRPNGGPAQSEDSQGPSVVDRSSREIEVRWAKETIGLVAVQLNEAYAQFEIRRDGHTIPGGLSRAAERLGEVLQCLGIAGNLDEEIPF